MALSIREQKKAAGWMPVSFRAPRAVAARFQALAEARQCTDVELLERALDALESVPFPAPTPTALGNDFYAAAACALAAA